jgi:tripartite-type tricarboxylate transporter receptor subunit TctC
MGYGGQGADNPSARPITMVVPFPPGGAVDPVARIVAERMMVPLGQSIVISGRESKLK